MPARIVLVRHGPSALRHDGRWLPSRGVSGYERAYDVAGIRDDDAPPADVCRLAAAADHLVASDLRRAVESARKLAPAREVHIEPLLREIVLEPPAWLPGRWPIEAWDGISYFQWSLRLAIGIDHELVRRAESAARWLSDRVGQGSLVAVTHGGFRRILTHRLMKNGWRCVDRSQGYRNWSAWTLESSGG